MIVKAPIKKNLDLLERLFNNSVGIRATFYSKLAILELCGWVEESMDDIILRCATRKLREPSNHRYVEKQIIKRNNGFVYDSNFRRMLLHLIGLINIERLERKLDPKKFQKMEAALRSLKEFRNKQAHTYIKGITHSLAAPSKTKNYFDIVYDGLKDVEKHLRLLKLM